MFDLGVDPPPWGGVHSEAETGFHLGVASEMTSELLRSCRLKQNLYLMSRLKQNFTCECREFTIHNWLGCYVLLLCFAALLCCFALLRCFAVLLCGSSLLGFG